ncbi:hypothetical protein QQ045_028686 [Rhodiola kirilowii]
MDGVQKEEAADGGSSKGVKSVDGNDEELKKCLEENKGDRSKCKSQVEAFKSSFDKPMKPSTSLWLRKSCSIGDFHRQLLVHLPRQISISELVGNWDQLSCGDMDGVGKGEAAEEGNGGSAKGVKSVDGNDEELKKCLEENKGERSKCKSQVEAFKSSFDKRMKPSTPLRLRSGSLTDI